MCIWNYTSSISISDDVIHLNSDDVMHLNSDDVISLNTDDVILSNDVIYSYFR